MKKKSSTIIDIAKYLNVTPSTVSRALSDHPAISKTTKQLVRDAAKKLNYQPNSLASNLRKGTAKTIGLIVPSINRHFFSNVIHGVELIANAHGYSLIICQSSETFEKEKEAIKTMAINRVAGLLLSISRETTSGRHIQNFKERKIPVVLFDRVCEGVDAHKVLNDNKRGGYLATQALIDQGYQNIVHFAGPQYINIYKERFEGYRSALEDNKLSYNSNLVFENVLTREEGYMRTKELMMQGTRPDAIFAASDYSALGAMLALKELKVGVPSEIGVVGFANEPFTELTSPTISTVEQYSVEMGKTAARLLFEEILNDDDTFVPKQLIITPELIHRESSMRMR